MTAVLPPRADFMAMTVTPAEYEALPPNPRVELVDGVVHVMPPATRLHQDTVKCLERALEAVCPKDLVVVREQELRMRDDLRRNPDLMVIDKAADDPRRYSFKPDETLLAVEVVSPGTTTIDRLHKRAEYAAAGVAHYWLVEPEALSVHTYQLGEAGYLETGIFQPGDTINAPGLSWAKIAVDDLRP